MIEFFFDCSSPWTYLAFHNIQPLAKEFGVEISWRPILVGGIFNTVKPERLCLARGAGAVEGALPQERPCGLGTLGRACDQDAADRVSREQREGNARLHSGWARIWCRFARAVFAAYWGDDKVFPRTKCWRTSASA